MNLKKSVQFLVDFGIQISAIARAIGRSHSTISKWLHGELNISIELEQQLINYVNEKKNEMKNFLEEE